VYGGYRRGVPITYVSRFAVDDAALSRLHARAFGAAQHAVPWGRRLQRHALTWIGAFDGDRLIGFVQVAWDGGEHAFLLDTAVHPDHRRRGVGVRLVEAAVRDVAAAGCTWLHVDFEPHLAGFYLDRCGFRGTAAGLLRLTGAPAG
jgi:ribosomal protein S18 acetylase RimI-like enzyme